jgi:ribosomal subunit interface protein
VQTPVQINFQDVSHSPAIENLIHEKVQELERHFARITACKVWLRRPHKHRRNNGEIYHVTVEVTVPGKDVVAGRDPGAAGTHDDLQTAIRDSFRAAKRQLLDHVHRMRRDVKALVSPPHGRVVRLFPYEGFGFLLKEDGQEVYFHRHAVLGDVFDELQVGDEVRFAVEDGEKGLQATTVTPTSRHLLPRDVSR